MPVSRQASDDTPQTQDEGAARRVRRLSSRRHKRDATRYVSPRPSPLRGAPQRAAAATRGPRSVTSGGARARLREGLPLRVLLHAHAPAPQQPQPRVGEERVGLRGAVCLAVHLRERPREGGHGVGRRAARLPCRRRRTVPPPPPRSATRHPACPPRARAWRASRARASAAARRPPARAPPWPPTRRRSARRCRRRRVWRTCAPCPPPGPRTPPAPPPRAPGRRRGAAARAGRGGSRGASPRGTATCCCAHTLRRGA